MDKIENLLKQGVKIYYIENLNIEWQQAGYLNHAKQLLKNETNKLQRN